MGVGTRVLFGQADIKEHLIATGATTFQTKPRDASPAFNFEAGWATYVANYDLYVAPVVSFTATRLNTKHTFANGTSLGVQTDWYISLLGQIGTQVHPNVIVFGEGGVAFAQQTLNVTFASFSTSSIVPGVVAGGGVKFAVPDLNLFGNPVLITARYQHLWFNTIEGRPPGSAFDYRASTRADRVGVSVEVPLGNGR